MSENKGGTIVWFRRDLRLTDNYALTQACEKNDPVYPVFIYDPASESPWEPGGALKWWLHESLSALKTELHRHNTELIIREGDSLTVLRELIKETGATSVYWNRLYEPTNIPRDTDIKKKLNDDNIDAKSFTGYLLFEPQEIKTKAGDPYKVFTPFWNYMSSLDDPPAPLEKPSFVNPGAYPKSLDIEDLKLLPQIKWYDGFSDLWTPGSKGAWSRIEEYTPEGLGRYGSNRNDPSVDGTSRLSPHLHWGEISPTEVWYRVKGLLESGQLTTSQKKSAWGYLRQLGWREFSAHLLFHFNHLDLKPLRPEFKEFPWKKNRKAFEAWQKGQTGYPIVDAGMRQLWKTGWMHNRVRMITASFLVKHLLIPWQEGAKWFWDTLVDADLGNNTMGWQWTAGCGADAAPYFRIFNPITQGEKFDPKGEYTRVWVPELKEMPAKYLYKPWEAPSAILDSANVKLGKNYPNRIVEHKVGREEALAAYQKMKNK